ncbi:MAG: uroporphyrinogen-III synthase [Rhodospirillaceae bacterium]|nr:uroporphyrinogen-III synthase [Rhodospirillaceae bacterium]
MRVLIVRARGDAEATAGALRARGHVVAAHPLVAVEATDEAAPNLAAAQAFIVTDADGARALANAVGVRTFPVFCDGDASAAELARLGFTDVRNAHGDAGALAKAIEKSLSPKLGALIYVCSTSAPINLSAMLNNAGFSVRMSALYAVRRAEALPDALQQELRAKAYDAGVFFSPDEARAFAQLVQRAELDAAVRPIIAVVASPVVAAPLTVLKFARIVSAPKADAGSVVAMVDDALLPKPEAATPEAPKPEAPKPEAPKPEPAKPRPVAAAKPAPAPPPFIAPIEPASELANEPKKPEVPPGPGVFKRLGTTIKARWQRAQEERAAEAARREAERPERERIAAEQREHQRIEAERLRAERAEAAKRAEERFVQDRAELARRDVERREQARIAAEQREQERLEQQRLDRERREAELAEIARAEAERRQMTQEEWAKRELERAEELRQKLERSEQERLEQARQEKEKQEAARQEKERLAAERRKQEQLAAEAARIAAEQREQQRLEAERLRAERTVAAKLAEERFAQEQAERVRRDVERREQERQQAEEREQQRLEQQRLDKERREAELQEIARAEAERRQMTKEEWARREQERAEQLRQELARSEQERLERARQEKARQEAIRREKERLEAERREREKQDAERREREKQEAERREKERLEAARLESERLENERREKERASPPHGAVEIELAPMPEVPALGAAVVAAAAATVLEPPRVSGLAPTSAAPSPVTEPALEEQSLPALDAEDARIAAAVETPAESAGLLSRLRNLVTRKRPPPPAPQADGLRARPETTAPPSAPPAGASEIDLRIDAAPQPLDAAALAPLALDRLAQDRTVLTPPATPDLPEIPSASPQEPGLPQPEMIPMVDLAALPEAAAAPPHSPPTSKQAVAAVVEESMKEETPLATMAPPAAPAENQKLESPQTGMSPPDDLGQDQAPEQAPEQAKAAPASPRGGGRAARLLAEDAADARALNQRFRVGSGEADAAAETPVEDVASQQTYKKQSSAGRRFAMFVIAVIVVAGGILFSAPWWAPQVRGVLQVVAPETAPPAPATPTLEQVTALQARAEALAADVTALNARLAAVEQRPAPAATDGAVLAALTERVKALESRPSTGATASPEGLADSVVNQARQLTNVTARVATLEAAIGNVARLEDVATRLNALEGKSAEANSVLALGERIAALEKRDQIAATALVLATAQLRAAVNAGRAYAIELETVNQLAARAGVAFNAEPLASRASTGAPRAEALTAAFAGVAAATVRAGAAPDANAPWLRRVLDRALSVLSIRPVGTPEGPAVGAVVARAETALTSGDLAGAVRELETLAGAPATAAAGWLNQAKAKVAADSALNELAARSVGAMGSSTAAKTGAASGAAP